MTERDQIYVEILHAGLIALKNASYGGDVEYWKVESDHLHNLPSLIGESNELRHDYYFDKERTLYLERVAACNRNSAHPLARYRELWLQLENLRSKK
jgi:hypothetical protein